MIRPVDTQNFWVLRWDLIRFIDFFLSRYKVLASSPLRFLKEKWPPLRLLISWFKMFTYDILVILQYRYKSVNVLGSFQTLFSVFFLKCLRVKKYGCYDWFRPRENRNESHLPCALLLVFDCWSSLVLCSETARERLLLWGYVRATRSLHDEVPGIWLTSCLYSSLTSANNLNLPTLLTLFYFSTLLYLLVQV